MDLKNQKIKNKNCWINFKMKSKILYQGAEANIYLENGFLVKERVVKGYRLKEIDDKIRKQRTRAETKILEKASKIISCPKPLESKDKDKILMPFIEGKKLSDSLDSLKNASEVCKKIGENLSKLHDAGIIHGDLTTSNMIVKGKEVYFIDFGLGFHSDRIEDRAVDLHLIKQALDAKHFKNSEKFYNFILEGYKISKNFNKVLIQLKKVESRGRYKH
jgi:Kae1-associated kinase Bud32